MVLSGPQRRRQADQRSRRVLERRRGHAVTASGLTPLDRVYLRRAVELAERGRGSTGPNPMVGAVVARGATTLGEGFHHMRGEPHAEIEAFADAAARGHDVRGATLYVSLEPCDHTGATPPCSATVLAAGVARVVVGTLDPNPKARGGLERLATAGVATTLADDSQARALIEDFAAAVLAPQRPYLRLKMAVSLDGYVAPAPGRRHWLTGEATRAFVRELRAAYDAVLVGAGTVRVDDPQLSVRPPRARRKPYVRVVACEEAPVPADRAVFAPLEGYARTIVLAPAARRASFVELETVADVTYVEGPHGTSALDLPAALAALRGRGIASVLCEGGPTLAGRLLAAGLVDRIDWIVAPQFLGNAQAVAALGRASLDVPLRYDAVRRLGPDLHISAVKEASCSAD